MIDKIKQFFSAHIAISQNSSPEHRAQALQMATAALLIEVSRADFSPEQSEQQAILERLRQRFHLPEEQLHTLMTLAQRELDQSVSLYQFTQLINDAFSAEQKSALILSLWQVAYADGKLDKHEDHLIRKIADLIHVSHSEFIRTKLIALDKADS